MSLSSAADALAASGELSLAIGAYERALEGSPADVSIQQRLCHARALAGQREYAVECAHSALAALGEDSDERWFFHALIGEVLSAEGEHTRAASSFERAAALRPDDPALAFNVGVAWRRAGRAGRAEAALRLATQLAPTDADAYTELAAAQEMRLHASSVEARVLAAKLAPQSVAVNLDLGHSLLAAKRASEAFRAFQVAVTLDPLSAVPQFGLSQALASLRRYDEAFDALTTAARLAPADAEISHAYGVAAWTIGRHREARKAWLRAKGLAPTRSDSLSLLRWSTRAPNERCFEAGASEFATDATPRSSGLVSDASKRLAKEDLLYEGCTVSNTAGPTGEHDASGSLSGGSAVQSSNGWSSLSSFTLSVAAHQKPPSWPIDHGTDEESSCSGFVGATEPNHAWVSQASHILSTHGVVLLTEVLNRSTTAALRRAIQKVISAPVSGSTNFDTSASTFENHRRRHLAMPLREPAVLAAVDATANALFRLLSPRLGGSKNRPFRVMESGVLLSRPGAAAQRIHGDTDAAEEGAPFFKVQFGATSIDTRMGPIEVIPGTHHVGGRWAADAQEGYMDGRVFDDEEAEERWGTHGSETAAHVSHQPLPIPIPEGALLVYNSAIRHRGGANRSKKKRAVFYITLARPTCDVATDAASGEVTSAGSESSTSHPFRGNACCPLGLPYTIQPEDAGCALLYEDGLRERTGCTTGKLDHLV